MELQSLLDSLPSKMGRWTVCRESTAVRSREPLQPEQTISIFRGSNGQFRVETAGYWGDARLWACDGKTLLIDPLSQYEPAVLRKAISFEAFVASEFKPQAYSGSLLAQMLMKGAYNATVDTSVDVTRPRPTTLRFKSKANGFVELTHVGGVLTRLEYDNKPSLRAAYQFNPLWNAPVADPWTQELISFEPRPKVSKGYLSVTVPEGLAVIDERPK